MDVDVIGNEVEWYIPWVADVAPVEAMLPPEGILHKYQHTPQKVQTEDIPPATYDYAGVINDIYALLSNQNL